MPRTGAAIAKGSITQTKRLLEWLFGMSTGSTSTLPGKANDVDRYPIRNSPDEQPGGTARSVRRAHRRRQRGSAPQAAGHTDRSLPERPERNGNNVQESFDFGASVNAGRRTAWSTGIPRDDANGAVAASTPVSHRPLELALSDRVPTHPQGRDFTDGSQGHQRPR